MRWIQRNVLVVVFFFFFSAFIFRDYILKGRVPFPANLLISFYQPYAAYEWEGVTKNLGLPHKPVGHDNLRIFYPMRKVTIAQMKDFSWPLWNPYSFAGTVQLATYQAAVFHPLSFLFFILPQIDAWSIIVVLQPLLASCLMYLFLKELSLGKRASFFGALIFGFSPFSLVWMEDYFMAGYSGLFLPLILYANQKMRKKVTGRAFVLFVLGLAFSVFSGWFQTSLYVGIFIFVWIVYSIFTKSLFGKSIFGHNYPHSAANHSPLVTVSRWIQLLTLHGFRSNLNNSISKETSRTGSSRKETNRQYIFYSIVGSILAILISAVHLLPNFETYLSSSRGTTDAKFLFDHYLSPLSHLVTLLAPDFFGNPGVYNYFGKGFYHEKVLYIGIVALFFVLYEVFMLKKNNAHEKFFAVMWIITLSLGFSLPTSWWLLYNLKLPFLSTMVPSRIFFVTTFCSAVLAAYGIERYLDNPDKKKIRVVLVFLGLVLVGLWSFLLYYKIMAPSKNEMAVSLRNLILPSFVFIAMALLLLVGITKTIRRYVYFGLVVLVFAAYAYFANKYFYFSEKRFVFPDVPVLTKLQKISGINRVWSYGRGYIERNFLVYYQLFSAEGYDSIYIKRYGELFQAAQQDGIVTDETPRVDATFLPLEEEEEILADPRRKKLLSLLGVRYIAGISDTTPKKPLADLEPIWNDGVYTIYEYKQAYPRFFLTNDYLVRKDKQEVVKAMFDPQTDLRKTLILEEEPLGFSEKQNNIEYAVKLISYKPQEVYFSVTTSEPALLFLSDTYYPGWKAYIDEGQSKIYRADYTFRAVMVPKGEHSVIFRYKPLSFTLGFWSTTVGILLLVIIASKIRSDNLFRSRLG